jgi:hypothetical protein
MIEAKELVRRLREATYRSKTGILLLPPSAFGHEADIAAQLNIQHVDFVTRLLARIPRGSDYVHVTFGAIIDELDKITNAASGMNCIMLSQIDVAVTKLSFPDRVMFWPHLLGDFPHRRKGLLLAVTDISDGSELLQDPSSREAWLNSDRMARWEL